MINKIDFATKNLKSNAGLFLLLENAKANDIFELIDTDLIFWAFQNSGSKSRHSA